MMRQLSAISMMKTCGVLLVENHDYLVRLAKLKVDLKEKVSQR